MLLGFSRKNPNRGGVEDIDTLLESHVEILDMSRSCQDVKILDMSPRSSGEKKLLPLEIPQICVTTLGNPKVKK